MSTFKDMNRFVVVAILQLATSYLMTRSRLDWGDWDGHWVLCPSLVNCRQNATTCWSLYPTYERAKDDRQLIFHLHENGTKHV